MSMPSSRLDVATTQGSTPPFSSSSTRVRCSRDIEPWCAFATAAGAPPPMPDCPIGLGRERVVQILDALASSAASSLSREVSRSASRRELANTIVERCARTSSSSRRSTAGQIDGRCAVPAAEPTTSSSELPGAGRSSSAARSGTGTSTDTSIVFGGARLHDLDRAGAGEEGGHLVERPDGGRQADPLRRPLQQLVEPLQRQRQVRAALGARDGVHLVEDHGARRRAATPARPR